MTKEILDKLIAHYEMAVEKVRSADDWYILLFDLDVFTGICACARSVLSINIGQWASTYSSIGGYWCDMPSDFHDKTKAIECLQFRIDKMKELLPTVN